MLFHDTDPLDIVNPQLQREALTAQAVGEGIAIWHGVDAFTGEDVEILMVLRRRTGGMAMNDRVYPARIMEKAHMLVLVFTDQSKGQADFNIDEEVLPMNLERTGIEVFNNGQDAHLRLFDKLTGQDIIKVDGDEFHDLVNQGEIKIKDYHGSAFSYAQGCGAI